MRLDHIAYRVVDRQKTSEFFAKAFGYEIQDEFTIYFDEEQTLSARCMALKPPEKINEDQVFSFPVPTGTIFPDKPLGEIIQARTQYHLAPEIFVSDGTPDSIVGRWVAARDNIGGVHHLAYEVENVAATMEKWIDSGWAEFLTERPMTCPGLIQAFTKPHPLTGMIYELIKRDKQGFCQENVKGLMESTDV